MADKFKDRFKDIVHPVNGWRLSYTGEEVSPQEFYEIEAVPSGMGLSARVLEPGTIEQLRFDGQVNHVVMYAQDLVRQLTEQNPEGEI